MPYEVVEGVNFDVLDDPEFESLPQELKDKVYEKVSGKLKDFHGIATRAQQQSGQTQQELSQWRKAQTDMPQLLGPKYLDIAKAVQEEGLSSDEIIERIRSAPSAEPSPPAPTDAQTQQQQYEQQIRDLAFQAGRGEISDEEANRGIGALSHAIMGIGGNVGQLDQKIEQAKQEGQNSIEQFRNETQQGLNNLQGQVNTSLALTQKMMEYNETHPGRQASKILAKMSADNVPWETAEYAIYGQTDQQEAIDKAAEEKAEQLLKEKGYVKAGEGQPSPEGAAESQWGAAAGGMSVFRAPSRQRPESEDAGNEHVNVRDMGSFQEAVRARIAEKADALH